jgi:D-mannonate dehydratase
VQCQLCRWSSIQQHATLHQVQDACTKYKRISAKECEAYLVTFAPFIIPSAASRLQVVVVIDPNDMSPPGLGDTGSVFKPGTGTRGKPRAAQD